MSRTKKRIIMLCCSKSCTSKGYPELNKKLHEVLNKRGLNEDISIDTGMCHKLHMFGPIMIVNPDNILYIEVSPEDIEEIVDKHLINDETVKRLLLKNPKTGDVVTDFKEAQRIVREIKGK